MNIGRLIALVSGAGMWIAACGGTSSNGGSAPPVAAGDFASSYAHAVCDNIAACCAKEGIGYDANACFTAVQGIIQGLLVNPATAAGSVYDATAAGDCIAKVRDAAIACNDTTSGKTDLNSACNRVYSGTKKPGESCNASTDCAASADGQVTCDHWSSSSLDGGTSSGTLCQVRKTPTGGEPCGGIGGAPPAVVGNCDYGASDTFACDYTSHTCVPRAAVGAACTSSDSCVTTAYCSSQKCVARVGIGGACTNFGSECDATSRCDTNTKLCVAKLADGAACMTSTDCTGGHCTSNKCKSSSYADPTVCGGPAH